MRDGPARGLAPIMARCPVFLRVVHNPQRTDGLSADACRGHWDVLDQLDDEPIASEAIYVYRRVRGTAAHACDRGRGGQSGWVAEYVHVPGADGGPLPDVEVRDTAAWRACVERLAVRFDIDEFSYG